MLLTSLGRPPLAPFSRQRCVLSADLAAPPLAPASARTLESSCLFIEPKLSACQYRSKRQKHIVENYSHA
jgi:hypothetical protein